MRGYLQGRKERHYIGETIPTRGIYFIRNIYSKENQLFSAKWIHVAWHVCTEGRTGFPSV